MTKQIAVDIEPVHPFYQDTVNFLFEKDFVIPPCDLEQYIKKWYGYEAEVKTGYDTKIVLHMTDHEYTLFLLRWS